jgi:hypothetical protein
MRCRGPKVIRTQALAVCALVGALSVEISACSGGELDECEADAARELVYGRSGTVATKGQALAHDSCGNGSFCHSQGATGNLRHGAPRGMNFDMIPSPIGLEDILKHRERSW